MGEEEMGMEEDDAGYERESDPPSLGAKIDGRVLVCRGDDVPDEFIGWLEWVVRDFCRLQSLSGRHDLPEVDIDFARGLVAFLEECGVEFESSHWEGACISGIFQEGWVAASEVSAVRKLASQRLSDAEAALRGRLHERLHERLRDAFAAAYDDMDLELLAQLAQSKPADLMKEVLALREQNESLKVEVFKLEKKLGKPPTR